VRIKGALHIHSVLSHDGKLTIAELARWYWDKGYDFIAIGEHSQDLDEEKICLLREQCAASSNNNFCVIPGVEFSCRGGFHIFGFAAVGVTREVDPLAVVREIHALNGLAILAHPGKYRWECPQEVLRELDAAEIWNVRYDGKYLPAFQAPGAIERMRRANPKLLAIVGHDFHAKQGFYAVGIEMEVGTLGPEDIFEGIRRGAYEIRSRYFSTTARPHFSWPLAVSLNLMGRQLAILRKVRDVMARWTT
jgi:predicted metal-dependent phosphoesterase TrpH